jgi:hypothetical protein
MAVKVLEAARSGRDRCYVITLDDSQPEKVPDPTLPEPEGGDDTRPLVWNPAVCRSYCYGEMPRGLDGSPLYESEEAYEAALIAELTAHAAAEIAKLAPAAEAPASEPVELAAKGATLDTAAATVAIEEAAVIAEQQAAEQPAEEPVEVAPEVSPSE